MRINAQSAAESAATARWVSIEDILLKLWNLGHGRTIRCASQIVSEDRYGKYDWHPSLSFVFQPSCCVTT